MKKNTSTNTFEKGMSQDFAKKLQPPGTYRYARNAEIIFNRSNSDTEDGESFIFRTVRGNKHVANLCPGYKIIGSIETRNRLIVFSTNGTWSEIGELVTNISGEGTYNTLFNDENDPNGDRFNFGEEVFIKGQYVYESDEVERIYWVQKGKEKRALNLSLLKVDGVPLHTKGCGQKTLYPKWMSVHASAARMDLVFPYLKFNNRIKGSLKSGTYQLFCRYISKDGHESVISTATKRVFVTTEPIDGPVSGVENAYKSNHHNRVMAESNVVTTEGIRWKAENLDTRWDYVQFGYMYHTGDLGFQEANFFDKRELTSKEMTVDLLTHTGTPVTRGQLNQIYETVLSVGYTRVHDDRMFDADLKYLPETILDTKAISITPKIRKYIADQKGAIRFSAVENPVTKREDNDPITNTSVTNSALVINKFEGEAHEYPIVDDYENYKGQQFESILKAFFRGETYPFGIVPIDRKGNPLFVQHIADFTFPKMHDEGFSLTEEQGPQTYMKIMGALFGNIRIPEKILRGPDGKLNLSGFMIVRAERVPRIKAQGIAFNCIETGNCGTRTRNDTMMVPMSETCNHFWPEYGNKLGNRDDPEHADSHHYMGRDIACGLPKDTLDDGNGNVKNRWAYSAPYYATFHSPDLLIEGKLEVNKTDTLVHVGQCRAKFKNEIELGDDDSSHWYNKSYITDILNSPDEIKRQKAGRPLLSQKSRIKHGFLHGLGPTHVYEDIDPDHPELDFTGFVASTIGKCTNIFGNSSEHFASLEPNAAVLNLLDFEAVDISKNDVECAHYRLFNYEVIPEGYYTEEGQTSLETRKYFSTGHYQQLTEEVLKKVPKVLNADGSFDYQFNQVEVWGGDCHVNLFDFTRLYPVYKKRCGKACDGIFGNPYYADYAVSHVIPNESKYNIALLYGRRFAANSTNPQASGCGGKYGNMGNGIMFDQPESWAYNKVLNVNETAQFFFSKPAELDINEGQDVSVAWSKQKQKGEKNDSYRINLPGDVAQLEGEQGRVTGLARSFSYLYGIQERGISILRVNAREFTSTDLSEVQIVSGRVWGGAHYISRKYGTQHPNSIWEDGNSFGFVDARMGKIIRFAQNGTQPLSEDKLDDFVTQTTIEHAFVIHNKGEFIDILTGFNPEYNTLYFTFHGQHKKTIAYNQHLTSFCGFYDFWPTSYLTTGRNLFMQRPGHPQIFVDKRGLFGQFFGQFYDTELRFVVNPAVGFDSFFDNGFISWAEGGERIYRILHESRDATHDIPIKDVVGGAIKTVDSRFDFKRGKVVYPMAEIDRHSEKARLCGELLEVTVFIANFHQLFDERNEPCSIQSFDTNYRVLNPTR